MRKIISRLTLNSRELMVGVARTIQVCIVFGAWMMQGGFSPLPMLRRVGRGAWGAGSQKAAPLAGAGAQFWRSKFPKLSWLQESNLCLQTL